MIMMQVISATKYHQCIVLAAALIELSCINAVLIRIQLLQNECFECFTSIGHHLYGADKLCFTVM